MTELAVYGNLAQAPAPALEADIFDNFVQWIDRTPKTAETYRTNLRQFWNYLQTTRQSRPTEKTIISYRHYLESKHLKPNTITAYMRSVKAFFKWTESRGIYRNIAKDAHTPKIDNSTHRKDAFSPEEVLTIERSISTRAADKTAAAAEANKDRAGRIQRSAEQGARLAAMYALAVNAGLRTVELSRANIGDLETRNGQTVLLVWGKGHSEPDQRKPLAEEVAKTVQKYLQTRSDHFTNSSPLFVSTGNRKRGKDENGNPLPEKEKGRLAARTISGMLKEAMREAGFDSARLTAHSLRHTCGTCVQELTGDIYQTQQYMRHSDPKVTEIYLHCRTEQREANTAERLYDLYHGRQERDTLESTLQRLTPEQLEQLTAIAAAMAK